MEMESENMLLFLHILVHRKGTAKVYRKFKYTGCYIHFNSNECPHIKTGGCTDLLIQQQPSAKKSMNIPVN
jgi:hypothetical protein